ncbi:hypothetical protein E2C01_046734 [Portunus trituberculatus]|uniref:Uncharacterized protein n=1 Tax=Portunus trituberculatus TaxID=210409 RepID=A0A5B7G5V8_PORTR|nr:hypothetical protein [Portunus trituberculatus]
MRLPGGRRFVLEDSGSLGRPADSCVGEGLLQAGNGRRGFSNDRGDFSNCFPHLPSARVTAVSWRALWNQPPSLTTELRYADLPPRYRPGLAHPLLQRNLAATPDSSNLVSNATTRRGRVKEREREEEGLPEGRGEGRGQGREEDEEEE